MTLQGQMQSKRNRLVIVLGMHRSGTSAVSRGLSLLGIELGENLHPPGADNPKGFWEDREVLAINEALLARIGSAYDQLGLVGWEMTDAPEIADLQQQAGALFREKFRHGRCWGFKDPRTARLLPFWKAVADREVCDVGYLIVVRNPISVAKSLQARNRFPPEKSYYLWQEHLVQAIIGTHGQPRVVVDYDLLLEQPGQQWSRVAKTLSLWQPDPVKLSAYASDFLDAGMRHTYHSHMDFGTDPALPGPVLVAYDWLQKAARDEVALDDTDFAQAFNRMQSELAGMRPALRWMASQDREIARLEMTVAQHNGRLQAIYQSRSWRCTRPLRLIENALRALARRRLASEER